MKCTVYDLEVIDSNPGCAELGVRRTYVFVFSPKWDMRWLRAKEIKDSPNSQAVPKILAHKKLYCLVPHWPRFLLFLQYSLAWLVSQSWLYQMLWDSQKFRTKENQRQPDFTSSPWYPDRLSYLNRKYSGKNFYISTSISPSKYSILDGWSDTPTWLLIACTTNIDHLIS